jgi:two-component system, NarL family, nitrate/nitrite response regulator NarL
MATALSRGIRVIIIDDHQIVREGLRLLIHSQPGLKVVGDAGNCKDALAVAAREQPEVILLDLDLGTESGTEIIPKLLATAKTARVLALTGLRDPEVHRQAILHGAVGVVQKEKASEVLLKAIQKIHSGEIWYDRSKLGSVLADALRVGTEGRDAESAAEHGPALTQRETEIVALVSQGLQNKQIAERLFISHITVRHHLTSIFEKVGVSSRLELIVYAYNQGLAKVRVQSDH